jgi:hypothetical protein
MRALSTEQLAALAELHQLFESHGVAYWLFGGWAVDFHAGVETRTHEDIDIAVWSHDSTRLATLLDGLAWTHRLDANEDGYTCYERDGVRLEVAFLARDENGSVYTPLGSGRGEWPPETFGSDVVELLGVSVHVIRVRALIADKMVVRDDPLVTAKDRADLASLGRSSSR